MKKNLLCLLICLIVFYTQAQTPGVSIFYEQSPGDTREYIEYIPGNLPIIISAPHGGVKQSGSTIGSVFYPDNDSSLPDRNCGGTNVRDDNTEILVREIQEEIFNLTGCYAHVIINNLHRTKLDPNRAIGEATCGDSDAIDHWNAWHSFIDQASTAVEANWGKGLYIDLHGQSHSIARIELGYNISSSELNSSDLNEASIINNSTIKNLVSNNLGSLNHEQLVRGSESLGAKLKATTATFYNNNVNPGCGVTSGYRAIPSNFDSGASNSCDDTRPFSNFYFAGDFYNNLRHGSGPTASDGTGGGGHIDGIMSEVNRSVRDLGTYKGNFFDSKPQTLVPFAKDYAAVILDYIDTHYNDFAKFTYSSNSYATNGSDPTPSITGVSGGSFSSTSGLIINSSSGVIDVSASTVGNYVVTYAVGTCGYYKETQNIEITGFTPMASCQNINALLDGAGNVTITAADINDGSSIGNLSINIDSFTCANLGANNVTLTATDPGNPGNTDSCVAIVTVTQPNKPADVVTNETICSGETFTWFGNDYTTNQTGTTIVNDGCTANQVLNLTVDTGLLYYIDNDLDGYGSTTSIMLCSPTAPSGYSINSNDCNDDAPNINPDATEILNNAIDEDCDGIAQTTLEIDDIDLDNVTISPNPFYDFINIGLPSSLDNNEFNIEIFDLNGRSIFNKILLSNNGIIKVSKLDNLEQAVYLIKIINKETGISILKRLIRF
ncbi:T9SS type A sorting domain-containing protein [Flavivirga rizhaonensis]|uniref:T9SS type A sorting domain-containing protein n=1 Tax=Flavivirga rizhaonensis TaxID=2559571 RepID=A0A4S1E1X7_9FLAO|nr:T9SS type A sorting domain-containing protein [Flavivirga rizhaonensis]TGV04607.1 T9SS type A sorting domain-containing protein [Flavivirga rizhaonensis]